MKHRLLATPDTVQWGFFDARVEPVLKVSSGDSVELDTVAGGPRYFEKKVQEEYYTALPQLREIHEKLSGTKVGPHFLTGPIEVKGAKVGQTLSVTFEHLSPAAPVGYNSIVPEKGTLPDEFPYARSRLIKFDRERRFALFPRGMKLPLRPFFGDQGVAPPSYMERVSSLAPGVHGGNIDNKELVAGTTLHLPIHEDGARYSVGDGHALQGDGEVCLSALECAMHATVTLRIRNDMKLRWPMGETKTQMISMGFSPDLDEAARLATSHAVEFLTSTGLDRDDAYTLSSFMVDLHVTQLVNGVKGVHAMIPKSILGRKYGG